MKILIKSEDAKKLAKQLEQMEVTDSGVELGKDLFVDGKIIVNSADDVVDVNGQPIAGGGGSEFYVHEGYMEGPVGSYYNYHILSRVSTAYATVEDFNDDWHKSFLANAHGGLNNTMCGFSIESEKSGDFYAITTLDGEYHQLESINSFHDQILD